MENSDINLDALVIRISNSTSKRLKDDLLSNVFSTQEIPYIEAMIKKLEEDEKNALITLYHRRKAPTGKTFKTYELPMLKRGWVDSPSKFNEGHLNKIKRVIIKPIWKFWRKEYKWLLGYIAIILSLYLAYLKITSK